jgi:glycine/D-amino acid oxidase-like deaminating enzyme/nitrite reductase/ring-hydroxylating ferredoxin subunit
MNASGQRTKSLWMKEEGFPDAPPLDADVACDTVVVGAGMAGLSTAYELALAGQKVVVIDRGPILGGMTARTTAHLGSICDDDISALIDRRGEEMAVGFQTSQDQAIARIEEHVRRLGIDCDFRRVDAFLFPAPGMTREEAHEYCRREHEAAVKVGATVEPVTGVPLNGHADSPALRYSGQATFHPLRYLSAIAGDFASRGGRLFSQSPVTQIEEGSGEVRVTTDKGRSVTAARAVFATNSPLSRVVLHSKMAPYRTYAMAFELPKGALPDALYWDMADPYHYVRLSRGEAVDYLVTGGEDHKSGEADDGNVRFAKLEAWTRTVVPALGREKTRWSGQVLETIDFCAFIGRNPGSENVFVATGDSGQGITHGALAGILLTDLIVSGSSPWEAVYDPARKTPAGIVEYVRENLTAVQNFAEYLTPGEIASAEELKPGEGGIMRQGLSKLAVCRDLDGKLHMHSATCTHLGCIVHWNSTEQCWDCPCHGSQFAPNGAVLNAPAISRLAANEKQ